MNIFIVLIACFSMALISCETSNGMFSPSIASDVSFQNYKNHDNNPDSPKDTRPSNVELIRSERAFDALASQEFLEDLASLTDNDTDNDAENDEINTFTKIKQLLARFLCRSNSRDT